MLAIMDALGIENEYIIVTSLPFTFLNDYHARVPTAVDVRTLEDARIDFDACVLGGGKVDWGFGWSFLLSAIAEGKPAMAYGIALRTDQTKHEKLYPIYSKFFQRLNTITVRDEPTRFLLSTMNVESKLTACPAINLKEEKRLTLEGSIVVCPRFGDYNQKGEVDNEPQIEYLVSRLKQEEKSDILLIPFFPKDREGHERDLVLCHEINKRLGGGCIIFPSTGYNARTIKYAISRSRLVISGGRYHAIVWAIAHDIPYEITPTISEPALSKINGLSKTFRLYGRNVLKEMELMNKKLFEEIMA